MDAARPHRGPAHLATGDAQLDHAIVDRLYRKANADRWGVSHARFASALAAGAARAFPEGSAPGHALDRYLTSLHLEDLALACACADGHEGAWDHFVREHRPVLYRAADAIAPSGGARDVADSLYAELFGLSQRDGERLSLFRYFHGRSSLATWLRSVLAQRYVDRVRAERRLDPLPPDDHPRPIAAGVTAVDPTRERFLATMRRAVTAAVAQLAPRDRLRLACYYAQDLTLAQIGRLLGEHEATASRHLTRTRRSIREDVERQLRHDEGMSEAELAECFASVVDDSGPLDLAEMLGGESARKKAAPDRSH